MNKAYINAISDGSKRECLEWLIKIDAENDRLKEESVILSAILNQARETLLIGIKGTPEELQRSLGKLNLACKAHWDWQSQRVSHD